MICAAAVAERREMMRLNGVEKTYGGKVVLRIGELVLSEGDRVLLQGPNGSAKSTLLRVIAGITQPSAGKVWRNPVGWARVGYLPQSGGVYPDLSLRDNLRLRSELYGPREEDSRMLEIVRSLGLERFWHKRCGELSGGYQRLAALAAALQVSPECLLLDEPLAALDESHRELVARTVSEFSDGKPLTIIVAPATEQFEFVNRHLEMREGSLL
jgi:ABC-type multidrug transport system ATPase subunit